MNASTKSFPHSAAGATALVWATLALLSFPAAAAPEKPGTRPVATPGAAVNPGYASSEITAIDAATQVVTAKVTATGQTFQFSVNDTALLKTLRFGQAVYADFGTQNVSLDGVKPFGRIVQAANKAPVGPGVAGPRPGTVPTAPPAGQRPGTIPTAPAVGPRPGTIPTVPAAGPRPGTIPAAPAVGLRPGTNPSEPVGGAPPRSNQNASVVQATMTAINTSTQLVAARVNDTGQTFQFSVKDTALLKTLQVGQAVEANLQTRQASVKGGPAFSIVQMGKAPVGAGVAGPGPGPIAAPPPPAAPSRGAITPLNDPLAPTGASGAASGAPGHVAAPQGSINLFELATGPEPVKPLTVSDGSFIYPASGVTMYSEGHPEKEVDFCIRNKSAGTLHNVVLQLVVTPSGDGPVDTVRQTISSWAPDDALHVLWVLFSWTPAPGTYTLTATIDPDNQFGESPGVQALHTTSIQLTQPPRPPPPPQTLILNPSDAGPAASIFSFNIQNSGSGNCTGGVSPNSHGPVITLNLPNPVPYGWGGCTLVATLYRGVALNEGWTVKTTALNVAGGEYAGNMSLGTISPNPTGGRPLEMQFQSSLSLSAPYPTDTLVQLTIEGPQGTTPFGNPSPKALSNVAVVSRLKALGVKHGSHGHK
jgi:Cu/Ag efflux protein CusF